MLVGILGTTPGRLWPQTLKNIKKYDLFDHLFDIRSYFSGDYFFVCFLDLSPAMVWTTKAQAGLNGKVETTIPYGNGHENQAFETCVFCVFVNCVRMFSRRLFFLIYFKTSGHISQFRVAIWNQFSMKSCNYFDNDFQALKNQKSRIASCSPGGDDQGPSKKRGEPGVQGASEGTLLINHDHSHSKCKKLPRSMILLFFSFFRFERDKRTP